jgi:ankyrin repeat protein
MFPDWEYEYQDHDTAIELLLQRRTEILGHIKENMDSLLSIARECDDYAIVELLLGTGKIDVSIVSEQVCCCATEWIDFHEDTFLKMLLVIGKVELGDLPARALSSLLSWAARKGHLTFAKILLASNNCNAFISPRPLALAAVGGFDSMVELLLAARNVDINAQSLQSPLYWAVRRGHENVVKLILATGKAEVHDRWVPLDPFLTAVTHGHDKIVQLLLATGKVDIKVKDQHEQTALELALLGNHASTVKVLEEYESTQREEGP